MLGKIATEKFEINVPLRLDYWSLLSPGNQFESWINSQLTLFLWWHLQQNRLEDYLTTKLKTEKKPALTIKYIIKSEQNCTRIKLAILKDYVYGKMD